jgi:hypothetical protein
MCGYELYVSETLYDEYYDAIIRHTSNEDVQSTMENSGRQEDAGITTDKSILPPIKEEGLSSS